jgi:hypothetical protein
LTALNVDYTKSSFALVTEYLGGPLLVFSEKTPEKKPIPFSSSKQSYGSTIDCVYYTKKAPAPSKFAYNIDEYYASDGS